MIQPVNNGGLGELRVDADTVDSLRRAITERWPVPRGVRDALVKIAAKLMLESDSERTKTNAMKVILLADKLNLEDEKRRDVTQIQVSMTPTEGNDEALDLAKRLRDCVSKPSGGN